MNWRNLSKTTFCTMDTTVKLLLFCWYQLLFSDFLFNFTTWSNLVQLCYWNCACESILYNVGSFKNHVDKILDFLDSPLPLRWTISFYKTYYVHFSWIPVHLLLSFWMIPITTKKGNHERLCVYFYEPKNTYIYACPIF